MFIVLILHSMSAHSIQLLGEPLATILSLNMHYEIMFSGWLGGLIIFF